MLMLFQISNDLQAAHCSLPSRETQVFQPSPLNQSGHFLNEADSSLSNQVPQIPQVFSRSPFVSPFDGLGGIGIVYPERGL